MPEPVPLLGAVKPKVLQVLLPSTVKVKPLPTIISSVERGIVPPSQVPGVLQLPTAFVIVVTVAENTFTEAAKKNMISKAENFNDFGFGRYM